MIKIKFVGCVYNIKYRLWTLYIQIFVIATMLDIDSFLTFDYLITRLPKQNIFY